MCKKIIQHEWGSIISVMREADRSGRLTERDEESTMKGRNNIG